jgi:hypothetical protein
MTSPQSISTQSPSARPLGADGAMEPLLEALRELFGDRGDLPRRAAGGDDHVIGDGGLAPQVDGDHVLGLVVVQRGQHQRQDIPVGSGGGLGGHGPRGGAQGARHGPFGQNVLPEGGGPRAFPRTAALA